MRAQEFPETFEFPKNILRKQIYKMCGNSVSVPVIEKIFNQIKTSQVANQSSLSVEESCKPIFLAHK